jgi:hypothetical protein
MDGLQQAVGRYGLVRQTSRKRYGSVLCARKSHDFHPYKTNTQLGSTTIASVVEESRTYGIGK